MNIRITLDTIHHILKENQIEHALIGGFGLSAHAVFRATQDIDFLVDSKDRDKLKQCLAASGWKLYAETEEVIHYNEPGLVDFLLARRPISRDLLKEAKTFGVKDIKAVSAEGIIGLKIQAYSNNKKREFKDKADIQALIENNSQLDWNKIKRYADLFSEWQFIQNLRDSL